MSLNQGSLGIEKGADTSGAPFIQGSAHNGVSIDGEGKVVLGNDLADEDEPAQLITPREIFIGGNYIRWTKGNISESNFTASVHQIEGAVVMQRNIDVFDSTINCNRLNDSFAIFIGSNPPR